MEMREIIKAAFLRGVDFGVTATVKTFTKPGEDHIAGRIEAELDACVSDLLTTKDAA